MPAQINSCVHYWRKTTTAASKWIAEVLNNLSSSVLQPKESKENVYLPLVIQGLTAFHVQYSTQWMLIHLSKVILTKKQYNEPINSFVIKSLRGIGSHFIIHKGLYIKGT